MRNGDINRICVKNSMEKIELCPKPTNAGNMRNGEMKMNHEKTDRYARKMNLVILHRRICTRKKYST
jgi:hypothetical protein